MGYIEKNLLKGESIGCKASIHGAIFFPAIISAVICFLAAEFGVKSDSTVLALVCVFSLIFSIVFFFRALIRKHCTEYALTNMRLIEKRGLLSPKMIDLPLRSCGSVSANQDALGKLFGYGTIVVTIGGEGGATYRFPLIKSPFLFRDNINRQIEIAPSVTYEEDERLHELPPSVEDIKPKDDSTNIEKYPFPLIIKNVGWVPTKIVWTYPNIFVINDNTNRFAICSFFIKSLVGEFGFEDIISAEIRVGKQVITTKKSISATGALAGGLIGGGLGAIVGGIGLGGSKTNTKLSKIVIHVILRNNDRMTLDIPCGTTKDAQEGMDLFIYAIDKADAARQNTANQQPIPIEQTKSKVNELKDLAELYTKGLISEEEYTRLKGRLLE